MRKFVTGGAIVALAAVTLLAGCTSSDVDNDEIEENGGSVVDITDQPGSVEDYEGAIEDSELTTCDAGGSGLEVAGTVTNPASDTQDYRIHVSAMDGGDTAGVTQVDVTGVAAGDTAEWATEIAVTGDALDCVLRVERFSSE